MNMHRKNTIVGLIAVLVVSGCTRGDPQLTRIKNDGKGPDEFTVLPSKPLQAPEDYSALPTPTPGGANLVDRNPEAEGIAALGGRASAVTGTGIGASDGGLVNHTRRYGVSGNIRQTLATEDVEVRRQQGRVNILNIGPNDDYTNAYRRQWLDSQAEQQRLQARGINTPAAPPPE